MTTNRKSAVLIGAFFMMAVATLFIGEAIYNPILDSEDYLNIAYPKRIIIMLGILIESLGIIGLIFIPIILYPFLKKRFQVLGLSYICIRLFEVILLTTAQINKLSLIDLSKEYLNTGIADATYFLNQGSQIKASLFWNNSSGFIYLIVFGIGALIFYTAMYKSKLIPRWLSIWGYIAALSIIASTFSHTFEISTPLAFLLMLPIAIQEQVMAVWLYFKGFNPKAVTDCLSTCP